MTERAPDGGGHSHAPFDPTRQVASIDQIPVPEQAAPPSQGAALLPRLVPLPVPRPPEFKVTTTPSTRVARAVARIPVAAPSAPVEDTRSFFDRVFGIESKPSPVMAYAALESAPVDKAYRKSLSAVPETGVGGGTAVYDITARVVHMPNGERLEAHSGLGETMDDPSMVHLPMRGATPPGTYELTEREKPFHGVRAIRLNPVGGSAAIHGRVGILAHTYLLGPNGASNGCVSFKDYDRFLQAYLRGEVQRIVVVAARG